MQKYTDSTELQNNSSLTKRWIIYLVGIYILTLGISLAIRAGIGISPQSSLTRTMTVIFPQLSQGTFSFLLELLMLLGAYLVLPKDFKLKYFAGLIPALALSIFLDLNLLITSFIKIDLYYAKVMLLAVADAALAFGLYLMIQANLVLIPVDLFVNTLFKRTKMKWGNIKTIFDCSLLVVSACIGLIFLGEIKFIREGTIINAILVGQYIKLYTYLFKRAKDRKADEDPTLIKG
ncbi:YczE/YyaS/YitT family protein [Brevibacillus fluminis]|uniref:YczE/YyaS/YitT family protein n=1 Tax=Brevibacillus fluminis TaxID=511487 RepID=UPI003F8A1620